MCIVHGMDPDKFGKDLPSYMPFIVEFVRLTTDKNRHPKLDYVK